MTRVLIAALVALIVSLLAGPFFIDFLRRRAYGQQIREEGPQHHSTKQGTPTMGGLLIVVATAIAVVVTASANTLPALTIFGTMLACGAIGFADDLIKLRHRRSLGLAGRWKMLLLLGIAIAVGVAAHHQELSHAVFVPVLNESLSLGWGWYVLVFFIIAGAANAVNLTDGVDGLAAGTSIITVFTLTAMAVTIYIRSGPPGERIATRLDAAFVGAALIGAAIGFLWFNAFPAEVFMGDTGSMALIHHHFEMKAWSETKIMVRFWIVAGILCAAGFALFYKYYPQIRPQ
jgi:phospho-N-acetylmuramoyl-pentapeptide-transferase